MKTWSRSCNVLRWARNGGVTIARVATDPRYKLMKWIIICGWEAAPCLNSTAIKKKKEGVNKDGRIQHFIIFYGGIVQPFGGRQHPIFDYILTAPFYL